MPLTLTTRRLELTKLHPLAIARGTMATSENLFVTLSDGETFSVHLAGGEVVGARRLLLATGVTDELPAIPGLAERWGVSAAQCPYCHGYELERKPIVVLGTHPGSAHHAMLVSDWSPETTFVTPSAPDAETSGELDRRGVRVVVGTAARLEGPGREMDGLVLEDGRRIEAAGLFLMVRSHPAGELVGRLGLALEEGPLGPYVRADAFGATSMPGIFAAGDLTAPFASAVQALASGGRAGAGIHRSLLGL